jgi:hypothetical protein
MKLPFAKFAPVVLALLALAAVAPSAVADQPLSVCRGYSGSLTSRDDGVAVLRLIGTAEALGKFSCYGEIVFIPWNEDGTLLGTGVVAFTAANGLQLVGVIAAGIDADGDFSAEIHWRDDVTFSDGTTVASSGRFVEHRPPGTLLKKASETDGNIVQNIK